MSLEDILKTTKAVLSTAKEDLWDRPDEWVRRQYQKIGDKIPLRAFYPCTTFLMLAGTPEIFWMGYSPTPGYAIPMLATFLHFEGFIKKDVIYNMNGLLGFIPHPSYQSFSPAIHKRASSWNEYNRYFRFPLLIAGTFFSAVAAYHFKEYVVDDVSSVRPFFDTITATGFVSTASSMYLKDRDPKRFQKDPFWKRAYDTVTERVKEYFPQPVPVPISVQRYAPVEIAASL